MKPTTFEPTTSKPESIKLKTIKPTLSLFALSLLFASPAHAQKTPPEPPGVSSQLQDILGGALKSPAKKSAGTVASTKFTSTGKPLFIDELMTKVKLDDKQKEQFRKYVAQVINLSETAYVENGFTNNDLGVAFAGLLDVCYDMNQGTFTLQETDKTRAAENKKKTAAVVKQFQRALGSSPAFQKIPNRAKQLAYEACAFTMGHLAVAWQQAGEDETKKEAVKKLAREQIQNLYRFDPDAITRSENGEFIPKKKEAGEGAAEAGTGSGTAAPEPPAKESTPPAGDNNEPTASAAPTTGADTGQEHGAAVTAPKGWRAEQFKSGMVLFVPQNLQPKEMFSIAIFPRRPLQGQAIEAAMQSTVQGDTTRPGKLAARPAIKASSGNIVSGTCVYTLSDGRQAVGIYSGFTPDKETIRMIRILSVADSAVISRYKEMVGKLSSAVIEADKKAAVAAGLDIEKLPPTPAGMSPGGPLQPGVYAGTQLYGNEVRDRLRLYLYPNGQYRMYNQQGTMTNATVRLGFKYDPRSGKFDMENGIQDMMYNRYSEPSDDWCLYGRDAAGKPYVQSYSNRGFSAATVKLVYVGPLDKPSPQEEEDKKAAIVAEAKRYKLVVPPGQGLKTSQIAGILMNQNLDQYYNGSGLSVSSTYDIYLLLNDGTLYNGLPVAPDELDVPRSRRQESEKWGRWKKQGKTILAAWPDAPSQFRPLKGELSTAPPSGVRLSGRYGGGESSGTIMGGSYRLWGVTFTPDGQFRKDEHGGYGSSITSQNAGAPAINSGYSDEESYTSVVGDNFVIGTGKKKKSGGKLSGTYSVSGYTLILRYDNGKIARLPFFFADNDRKLIWFEGAALSMDDPKK